MAGTDHVFLADEPIDFTEGDVSFRGTVGLVQKRGSHLALALGDAGTVRAGGRTLESDRPAAREW